MIVSITPIKKDELLEAIRNYIIVEYRYRVHFHKPLGVTDATIMHCAMDRVFELATGYKDLVSAAESLMPWASENGVVHPDARPTADRVKLNRSRTFAAPKVVPGVHVPGVRALPPTPPREVPRPPGGGRPPPSPARPANAGLGASTAGSGSPRAAPPSPSPGVPVRKVVVIRRKP